MSNVVKAKMASVLLLLMGLAAAGASLAASCTMNCSDQWACREVYGVMVCVKVRICQEVCVNER